ncbi:MAG: acetate--CoA ligase family protein [Deltaproteobacteria bacterium]|nr:acetate--CoA ligase family protein [Deltaproteobacteria bacterium]
MHKTVPQHSLKTLLNPRSVAVIGASEDQTKFGGRNYKHLLDHHYDGIIYPINPNRDVLLGLKTFPSIDKTPTPPDMAVMAVPQPKVKNAVRECAERGVKACIIITSKFSDAGPEGLAAEREIVSIASEYGMRIIGPNCLGMISPANNLVLCASPAVGRVERLIEAPVGFISQSGALMATLFDRAYSLGIGFSHCISIGNQADLELSDFIEFLIDDPKTKIICTYVEGLKSPQRLADLARRARAAGKPWLMVKAGSTEEGSRAAFSHTASMAGNYESLKAVCKHEKIIMLEDPINMLILANAMVRYQNSPIHHVAIVSSSGGACAIAADRLHQVGVKLAKFDPKTREDLANYYPPGQGANPVDFLAARADRTWQEVCPASTEIALSDPNTDLVLVVMTTAPDVHGMVQHLADGAERERAGGKPILFVMMAGGLASSARAMLIERRLPYVDTLDEAAKVLQAWKEWSEYREPDIPKRPLTGYHFKTPKAGPLGELDAKALLAEAGLPVNLGVIVKNVDEAIKRSSDVGFPLVMKVVSQDIVHKSDVGGVALNITSEADLRERFAQMQRRIAEVAPKARIDGYYLQTQEGGELELIVGARYDSQFGSQVLVGTGGVLVEVLRDMAVLPAPIDAASAKDALEHLKVARLFGAYRGRDALDVDAAVDVIVRLSWLAHDLSQNVPGGNFEIDINPLKLRVRGRGAVAVDVRVSIG